MTTPIIGAETSTRHMNSEEAQSILSKTTTTTTNPVSDWALPSPLKPTNNSTSQTDNSNPSEYEPLGILLKDPWRRDYRSERESVLAGEPTHFSLSPPPPPFASDEASRSRSKRHSVGVKRKSSTYDLSDDTREHKRVSVASIDLDEQADSPPSANSLRPRSQSNASNPPQENHTTPRSNSLNVTTLTLPPQPPARRSQSDPNTKITTLPTRKIFPIQVGDKLFRLSGASLSSDAPSYFTTFFEDQLRQSVHAEGVKTLYIDRDPTTFADIALHLQGYHVTPRDGPHFVKLFADAQFFNLPRLTAQLLSSPTIYIRIGETEFQLPRDIFNSPGDTPNYFSLGFSTFFTASSSSPSSDNGSNTLQRSSSIRPPSILPPSVPNRSAKTFADLMHVLKGYDVEIRDKEHRADLLRDARYFHLKGLEQKLIPHEITYNLARQKAEILIRLEDIRQSGVSFVGDGTPSHTPAAPFSSTASNDSMTPNTPPGWISYQRPYVDQEARALIVEISGGESMTLSIAPPTVNSARTGRITFYGQTLARITSLFGVIASKMNLSSLHPLGSSIADRGNKATTTSLPASPAPGIMGEERVKMRLGPDADVIINGRRWSPNSPDSEEEDSSIDVDGSQPSRPGSIKRKSTDSNAQEGMELVVRRSQWRIRIQAINGVVGAGGATAQTGKNSPAGGVEAIFSAVKIDGFSHERARNTGRSFLN